MNITEQLDMLRRGTEAIYSEQELADKLRTAADEGRQLRVKLGMDPTSPDIHLGHTVQLRKMRQFQDLGHRAVLIIGDFTARIGDPSGRSKTRPVLNDEQVRDNARTYFEQAGKVLDTTEDKLEIVYNSQWLEALSFADVLKLAGKSTVGQMLKREDFRNRFEQQVPIGVHEFMYPLMQGYDSVAIRSDIELGGTDQTFNNLVGRDLQISDGQTPQVVMIMPILVGLDGVDKMSKSLGNYVGLTDTPEDMFAKVMSISDEMMRNYFTLLTDIPQDRINELLDNSKTHPKQAKVVLGKEIVQRYYDADAAEQAAARFDQVHAQHQLPDDMPEVAVPDDLLEDGKVWLPKLLVHCELVPSTSEGRRQIKQNAVSIDQEKVSDPSIAITPANGMILQIGRRRFARLRVG